jgi:hypothetical protein
MSCFFRGFASEMSKIGAANLAIAKYLKPLAKGEREIPLVSPGMVRFEHRAKSGSRNAPEILSRGLRDGGSISNTALHVTEGKAMLPPTTDPRFSPAPHRGSVLMDLFPKETKLHHFAHGHGSLPKVPARNVRGFVSDETGLFHPNPAYKPNSEKTERAAERLKQMRARKFGEGIGDRFSGSKPVDVPSAPEPGKNVSVW